MNDANDDTSRAAVSQLNANLRLLRPFLPSIGHAPVIGAVFAWGPQLEWDRTQPCTTIDGVTLVPGARARTWLASLPDDELTADQVDRAWKKIEDHTRRRDRADLQRGDAPQERWNAAAGRFIRGTLAGLSATYVGVLALGLTDNLNLLARVALTELALVTVGVIAIRRPTLSTLARGWLVGSMAFGALVIVITINAVITANQ